MPGFKIGSKLDASLLMLKTILARVPDLDSWESDRGYPLLSEPVLAHDNAEWLETAKQKKLMILGQDINIFKETA